MCCEKFFYVSYDQKADSRDQNHESIGDIIVHSIANSMAQIVLYACQKLCNQLPVENQQAR